MKSLLICILLSTSIIAGEGHDAGREWAEENDVSSCGGNSESFIEGCEEYLEEVAQEADSEDGDENEEN